MTLSTISKLDPWMTDSSWCPFCRQGMALRCHVSIFKWLGCQEPHHKSSHPPSPGGGGGGGGSDDDICVIMLIFKAFCFWQTRMRSLTKIRNFWNILPMSSSIPGRGCWDTRTNEEFKIYMYYMIGLVVMIIMRLWMRKLTKEIAELRKIKKLPMEARSTEEH